MKCNYGRALWSVFFVCLIGQICVFVLLVLASEVVLTALGHSTPQLLELIQEMPSTIETDDSAYRSKKKNK